ncbi:molecular chaperone IbpA [Neorhizobium sp. R1-B]|uniref:Hsp20 family protein n=1 Tax=unclassified Neorhizobium TaxID=2629175 RepID=UPI001048932B|nr:MULTISPECIES: Hsp20 family protein [unclassified Neorhizobium]TCV68682.1 molecular chaperone IbpA [Neorhizobium sp. S3-V5DH]TDX76146.1 molecular chaperone IbpA [Neorhizobium sp. R1-B]
MRSEFDFTPLYRSSIGFDQIFNLLNNAQRLDGVDTWPPYDIVKTGEDNYRISIAVAGFAENNLDIQQERNVLVVKGSANQPQDGEYLHRGIATQAFERRFELAAHVTVENATLKNGLLMIALKREIPDAMKPRRITIGKVSADAKRQQIEFDKKVA